jgi:hypothetical protein
MSRIYAASFLCAAVAEAESQGVPGSGVVMAKKTKPAKAKKKGAKAKGGFGSHPPRRGPLRAAAKSMTKTHKPKKARKAKQPALDRRQGLRIASADASLGAAPSPAAPAAEPSFGSHPPNPPPRR